MNAIELFAGVGGFRIGLERAGHQVIWSNEWDRFACDVYDFNFTTGEGLGRDRQADVRLSERQEALDRSGEHRPQGQRPNGRTVHSSSAQGAGGSASTIDRRDITTVPADGIPAHDLLVGGFPCQAFSVAGKRLGFADTRGTLFFDIARVLKHHQPPYLVLENVKGLLSHDSGRTFQTILGVLTDLGYDVQWQVLNSKDFGVPQNRERVFIVGHLRGQPRPEVFPIGNDDPQGAEPDQGRDTQNLPTIRATEYKHGDNQTLVALTHAGVSDAERVYSSDGVSKTLSSLGGGMGAKTGLYAVHNLQPRNPNRPSLTRTCECGSGKLYKKCHGVDGGSGHISKADGSTYCLDTAGTQGVEIADRIRRLTPMECERLQGFPDGWTKYGRKPDGEVYEMSDTQRYKQMGNAVTTNVVYAIARLLG